MRPRDIPAGVRDAIRARLARLPEDGVALLGVAAVIGREFDLGLLAATAEVDDERALDLLELAFLLGVVIESRRVARRLPLLPRPGAGDALRRALRRTGGPGCTGGSVRRSSASIPMGARWPTWPTTTWRASPRERSTRPISYAVLLAEQATSGFAFELAEAPAPAGAGPAVVDSRRPGAVCP